MPKFTKCWYRDCDSDNRSDPNLLFYKFPKDTERCEQWIMSCSNPELTDIWNNSPDKVATLRVCQRHFLKEFLGTSSRLVGHAVPAPYGLSLDQLDADKFMVECASLRSSTSLVRQQKKQMPQSQQHIQPQLVETVNLSTTYTVLDELQPSSSAQHLSYDQHMVTTDNQLIAMNPVQTVGYQLAPTNHQPIYSQTIDESHLNTFAQPLGSEYDITYAQNSMPSDMTGPSAMDSYHTDTQTVQPSQMQPQPISHLLPGAPIQSETLPEPQYHQLTPTIVTTDQISTQIPPMETTQFTTNTNPRVIYNQDGNVVSLQYPSAAQSAVRPCADGQQQAEIVLLKSKVRYYQRKSAVITHRYQKLRSQTKGRSHKMRLLECLRICKGDFDPCVFEIFERQIKGPSSKHGNRWSNDVKSFSASIFLRSRSAFRFIRRTIDLPSDSIVKRYILDNKLSKPPAPDQDDDIDEESIADSKSH